MTGLTLGSTLLLAQPPHDDNPDGPPPGDDRRGPDTAREARIDDISPVRRIERDGRPTRNDGLPVPVLQFRSFDGGGNSIAFPSMNTKGEPLRRMMDAAYVYGSTPARAAALRAGDGSGLLKTSDGQLLPFNTEELPNAGGTRPDLFLAGDVRANEQVGLAVMHTLF